MFEATKTEQQCEFSCIKHIRSNVFSYEDIHSNAYVPIHETC